MYTREMQELLASTVEDYDPDRVLNLDDDKTTNFAVYAEETIVIEAAGGVNTVAGIDDVNMVYVIENVDEQITSLAEGDVFVYPYAENEFLIVKVDTITINGTTATINGGDLEMEEVFAAVKIESADSTENMEVDASTADDGVTFEGFSDPNDAGTLHPMGDEASKEFGTAAKYKIEKDVINKGEGAAVVHVEGSITLALKVKLSYYVSAERQHVDFRVDDSITGAFNISGKLEHEWKLCDAAVRPIPLIKVGFKPTIKLEASGEFESASDCAA